MGDFFTTSDDLICKIYLNTKSINRVVITNEFFMYFAPGQIRKKYRTDASALL